MVMAPGLERFLPVLKCRPVTYLAVGAGVGAAVVGGWLISVYGLLAAGALLAAMTVMAIVVAALRDRSARTRAGSRHALIGLASAVQFFVIVEPAPADLLTVLILGLLVVSGGWIGLSGTGTRWFMGLLGLWVVANVGSLIVSRNLSYSLFYALITLLVVMVAVVYYTICRRGESAFRWVMWAYVLGAGVSTWVVAMVVTVAPGAGARFQMFGGRIKGFFKDPNVFAPFLVVAFVFALVIFAESWDRRAMLRQALVALMAGAALWGVVFAYSRAAWASLVLTVAIFWGLRVLDSPRNLLKTLALLLVLVPVALSFQPESLISDDSLFFERIQPQAYDEDRFATQEQGFVRAMQSPLVGHGPGMTNQELNYAIHNSYLRVLFENGIIGMIPFVLLLVGAVGLSLRASLTASTPFERRVAAAIAACMIGTLGNSVVIDSVHWRHLWMLIGLGWATMAMIPAWQARGGNRAPERDG